MKDNILKVRERIEAACQRVGRTTDEVKLVAVTKTVSVERIEQAVECGLNCFGENYVQEALPKIRHLGPELEWHFIGHLQRNKVKHMLGSFHLLQSMDRLSLAQEIDRRAPGEDRIPVLIEVNIGGESTKSGVPPGELAALLKDVAQLEHILIRGLMTMPPFFDEPEKARPYFRTLREWKEQLQSEISAPHRLEELSMGMTGDFEAAIEEGATIVRIGTALFGPRPQKH